MPSRLNSSKKRQQPTRMPYSWKRPMHHVGHQRHAGRRRQQLPRHRLADVPHLVIDDGPEHDAGIARQLERRAIDDRRIVAAFSGIIGPAMTYLAGKFPLLKSERAGSEAIPTLRLLRKPICLFQGEARGSVRGTFCARKVGAWRGECRESRRAIDDQSIATRRPPPAPVRARRRDDALRAVKSLAVDIAVAVGDLEVRRRCRPRAAVPPKPSPQRCGKSSTLRYRNSR